MSVATEAEVTAVHAPGAEIAAYAPPAGTVMEEYRPRIVMQPEEAKALDAQLRECMKAILKEGVDYGTIPGAGDRLNLLKPGAEKLLQWFGFGSESREVKTERDDPDHPSGIADKARRIGVTYRTEVTKTIPGGGKVVVATCEGYAGYDEDRYYISAEDAVSKAEAKERMYARKDKREPNPNKWLYATEYRAPWNTLIKMAQKRSYVGASIDATSAAGLFTQDMEDATAPQPEGPKFGDVAMGALRALDRPLLEAVGKWYRGRGWPDPRDWDAEQWCQALQAAGFMAGQRAAQQGTGQPAEKQPGADPAEQAFADADAAFEQALRSIGDDGWAEKVRDIADEGEASKVIAEASGSKVLTASKRHYIRDAVLIRWPGAGDAEGTEAA